MNFVRFLILNRETAFRGRDLKDHRGAFPSFLAEIQGLLISGYQFRLDHSLFHLLVYLVLSAVAFFSFRLTSLISPFYSLSFFFYSQPSLRNLFFTRLRFNHRRTFSPWISSLKVFIKNISFLKRLGCWLLFLARVILTLGQTFSEPLVSRNMKLFNLSWNLY